eukprot:15003401-Ditylum_brightwellii.AAC.1
MKSASAVTSLRVYPKLLSIAQMKSNHHEYFLKLFENNHGSASVEAAEGQDDVVDIVDDQDLEMVCERELEVDVEGPAQSAGDAGKESGIIIDTWLNLEVKFCDVAVHQNPHFHKQIT